MDKYRIGHLDRRITFLDTNRETENKLGEIELKTKDLFSVWAKVEQLKGQEKIQFEKVDASVDYKIICRYNPEINQAMEIDFEGKRLEIISVTEIGRRSYIEILAVENISQNDRYKSTKESNINNVKVILGYPASGKTTYVEEKMTNKDLILDLDKINSSLTNSSIHERKNNSLRSVSLSNKLMRKTLEEIENEYYKYENIYYIRTKLSFSEIQKLKQYNAKFIYINTDKNIVIERLKNQNRENLIGLLDDLEVWYEDNMNLMDVII